jgi:hypothetical protein
MQHDAAQTYVLRLPDLTYAELLAGALGIVADDG